MIQRITATAIATLGLLVISACGSSNDTQPTDPTSQDTLQNTAQATQATITQENQEQILSAFVSSFDISAPQIPDIQIPSLKPSVAQIPQLSVPCDNGGTIEFSYPTDTNNSSITYTFSNCKFPNVELNGSITMMQTETGSETRFDRFTSIDQNGTIYIETGSEKVTQMVHSYSSEITMTGYFLAQEDRFEFENLSSRESSDMSTFTSTLNGNIKDNCTGGWINIKTIQPIKGGVDDDCPSEGEIEITGANNSKIRTVINTDKSIDVYLNDAQTPTETYSDCSQMPDSTVCAI